MATTCAGFSNGDASVSVYLEPCSKRPAGSTVTAGHVGQSCNTIPACGIAAAATAGGAFSGAAGWRAKSHVTNASTTIAAPTPITRTSEPGFQPFTGFGDGRKSVISTVDAARKA